MLAKFFRFDASVVWTKRNLKRIVLQSFEKSWLLKNRQLCVDNTTSLEAIYLRLRLTFQTKRAPAVGFTRTSPRTSLFQKPAQWSLVQSFSTGKVSLIYLEIPFMFAPWKNSALFQKALGFEISKSPQSYAYRALRSTVRMLQGYYAQVHSLNWV